MSDLISRSALIEKIEDDFCNDCVKCMGSCRLGEIREIVLNTPTVEAKPVIYCKDCEHWGTGVAGETEHVKCCEYGKYMVGANGYCCYADMRKKVE